MSGSRSPATPTLATVGPQVQTASAGSNAERASTHTGPPGHAARTKATTAPDRAAARGGLTGTTPCPRTGLLACRAKIVERAWGARSSGPKGKSSAGFARVPMEPHAWSQQDDLPTTARNRLHPVKPEPPHMTTFIHARLGPTRQSVTCLRRLLSNARHVQQCRSSCMPPHGCICVL